MPKHLTTNDEDLFLKPEDIGVPDGVAGLDSEGKVPVGQLPPLSGGGGAVDSVNGYTGVVTLDSDDVGAVAAVLVNAANGVAPLDPVGRLPVAKLPTAAVQSVNGYNGPTLSLTAADVGALTQTLGDARYLLQSARGAVNGVASLGSDGKVPSGQLPAGGGGAVDSVNGQTGTVVLSAANVGAIPTTEKGANSGVATLDGSGKVPTAQLPAASSPVTSVNTQTGAVVLTAANVGAVATTAVNAASGVAGLDSGTKLLLAQVPDLPASRTTSGTFATARIPDLSATYVPVTQKGAASGVATLGSDTKIPIGQLRLHTYNVKDYGATGDGTTDDSSFIQTTINNATAFGGWVVFPAGTYNCATLPIRIYGNVRYTMLPGAVLRRGSAGTLLLNGDAGASAGGYTGHGNILFEGGVLDMRGTTLTASAMCISIGHARDVVIRNVTVKDLPGYHAIELNSTKNALVENCNFLGYIDPGGRDFSEAIQIDLAKSSSVFGGFGPYDNTVCEDITIRDCYVGASGTAGTTAWPRGVGSHSATVGTTHRRIKIVNNTFEGLLQYGVVPYAYDDCTVTGNTIRSTGAGVRARTIISADAADSTNLSGVQTNASQVMKNLVITENIISSGGSYDDAILLYGETTGHIVGATISDNIIETVGGSENGIRVFWTDNYTVTGNEMTGVGGTGISQEQVTGGVVEDNRVHNCTNSGISCDTGTNMKISDNSIHTVGVNGIHVLSGSDIQLVDNSIKGASRTTNLAGYGIRVSTSTDDIRITGNRVRLFGSGNEVGYGLGITSTCTNVTRFGNEFVGGTGAIDDQSALPKLSPYDSTESLIEELIKPSGRWETISRLQCGTETQPTSGYFYLVPMYMPKGVVVSNITFISGNTAAVTPTNQWFMLMNSSRVAVARTADATTAAWAANTIKTLAIAQTTAGTATSYTTTYTGLHFLCFMVAATTMPTILGRGRVITTGVNSVSPAFGAANSGQTTPPAVTAGAFTAAATSGTAVLAYGYVS